MLVSNLPYSTTRHDSSAYANPASTRLINDTPGTHTHTHTNRIDHSLSFLLPSPLPPLLDNTRLLVIHVQTRCYPVD
jgi:hypothetical protein